MPPAAARAGQELIQNGFARLPLAEPSARPLNEALARSRTFFARPAEDKARHSTADLNFGYRPLGHEYSISADRPDLNECFTLWSDRVDTIPAAADVGDLTAALLAWRAELVPLVAEVIGELARYFSGGHPPDFAAASYLQVNGYVRDDSGRDLLQDRHEDGHLLTVIHATAPGLEVFPGPADDPEPADLGPGEILVMPGSVLTDLTGGKIAPLYHQVRNHRLAGRLSLMYFVNPEVAEPLYPWVGSAEELRTDLRERVMSRPAMFGLPDVPVL
ncbi:MULTISPECIES: isopenicillin N synthase family oxygenase [Kitasatospora]|uniref:isopenicillin N synthase family oxygenase n=1 Tax=Kitasatospora TaxID=2063 RepID=UPI000C70DD7B|nr:isopenicillin N synthase family oxygenase [Kitasatospora sp. GP30]MDH6139334.1 isopenicillin N synthase-like dioxygenase [Kitasatospora sp. GP30]